MKLKIWSKPHLSLVERERRRLKWTLGLFGIGLAVPLVFMLPRVCQWVKIKTFERDYERVIGIVRRLDQGLLRSAGPAGDDQVSASAQAEYRTSRFRYVGPMEVSRAGRQLLALEPQRRPWYVGYSTSPYEREFDDPWIFAYRARLSEPHADVELVFRADFVPFGRTEALALLDVSILFGSLVLGFLFAYRMGLEQIRLSQKHRDFVSAVSHELKSPLTSIRMYSEMLCSEKHDCRDKRLRYSGFIQSETERLRRLIDNVLHLARVTSPEVAADLEEYQVSELLEEALAVVEPQITRSGFSLEVCSGLQGAAAALQVTADRDAFVRILINLVDNSLKFSKDAQAKTLHLGCRLQPDKNHVMFFVRDYGPGIEPAQLGRIFDLFYRGESEMTRRTSGTGIGLALVRELAASMGAAVAVENREPGAEFRIVFPLAA